MRSFISICLIAALLLLGTSCTIRQFLPERKDFDAIYEGQNFIPNGNIEILDNRRPVCWNYQGKCAVGVPGFQSDYALTMEVSGYDGWAKWETQVESIKPHTKYAVSFWYRLPNKKGKKGTGCFLGFTGLYDSFGLFGLV